MNPGIFRKERNDGSIINYELLFYVSSNVLIRLVAPSQNKKSLFKHAYILETQNIIMWRESVDLCYHLMI